MKSILLLIVFISFSFANILTINKEFMSTNTNDYQTIIEDKNKNISSLDVLEDRYKSNYLKNRTSSTHSAFWNKLTIKNSSKKDTHIVFQNSRAGIDKIDVFIYKDKQLIGTHILGDLRAQNQRDYVSAKSVFHLEFPSNEEYVIISRLESLGPMNLSWQIYNKKIFSKKSSIEFLFNGLFAGVLIALIIYNFMLFLSLKELSFLLYVFLTSSTLWVQYTYSGMFYFLDIGINLSFLSISAWFAPYLYSGLFILFAITFFKIYERNKYFFYIFIAMSAIGFILSLLSLYLFIDGSFAIYTPYSYIYLYTSLIAIFSYAIYATVKGYQLATYFLLGEGIYLAAFFYSVLVVSGAINISNNLQFLLPSAMMIEVIFFSMALSKRVKLLKQNNDEHELLLLEESKFSAIGKSIGNIAHQWKTPLSQLNTHLLYLHGLYHIGDEKKLLQEFGSNIKRIDEIIRYIKSSIEELHDFYSDVNRDVTFIINKQISLAIALQNDKLVLNNISVNVDCDDKLFLVGAKHGFANILMILFDNSIYQFEKNEIASAKIEIEVKKIDNHIHLYFKDNAGGIIVEPIEKIFDLNFSTKGSDGSGFGLPLAKKLAQTALEGKIIAQNSENGAKFTLVI